VYVTDTSTGKRKIPRSEQVTVHFEVLNILPGKYHCRLFHKRVEPRLKLKAAELVLE
jgi:hypothetical protein